jgi:hypothetical protein
MIKMVEDFITHMILIDLFSTGSPCIFTQGIGTPEGNPTWLTVSCSVSSKTFGINEGFSTFFAFIGLLSTVGSHMISNVTGKAGAFQYFLYS